MGNPRPMNAAITTSETGALAATLPILQPEDVAEIRDNYFRIRKPRVVRRQPLFVSLKPSVSTTKPSQTLVTTAWMPRLQMAANVRVIVLEKRPECELHTPF